MKAIYQLENFCMPSGLRNAFKEKGLHDFYTNRFKFCLIFNFGIIFFLFDA